MSELQTTKITDRAGTGSPNFSQGLKISGTDSGLIAPTRTEGETQPDAETSSNGDTFYDTANDTYDILIEGAWVRVIGAVGDSTPDWELDPSNFSFSGNYKAIGSYEGTPTSCYISEDGTFFLFCGVGSDSNWYATLSTAYDISTMGTPTEVSYTNDIHAVSMRPDGTEFYYLDSAGKILYQRTLSTAFDFSTAGTASSLSVNQANQPAGFDFSYDGLKLFTMDKTVSTVRSYTLTTAWDITTATYDNISVSFNGSGESYAYSVRLNPSGTQIYFIGYGADDVQVYDLSTAFDITTGTKLGSFDAGDTAALGLAISYDGKKVYTTGNGSNDITEIDTGL
jgi:hypothetical protein